ncbi:MAG: phenylalanine--tRNA ligase subunit alpha [Candidatus Cloacimonadota bacterium]|nr:MAG: phenylalanine--tRNA ligase subunit alpha [Candidatus Cloacimonadota bacterium]
MKFEKEIEDIKIAIFDKLKHSSTTEEIETIRAQYLGRKGIITQKLKNIKNRSKEERPVYGKIMNALRVTIEKAFEKKNKETTKTKRTKDFFDYTIPGDKKWLGHHHPLMKTMTEIIDIFVKMGFAIEYGPDVETDYYNFEALNFPKDHPSRDTQDTFYLNNNLLLRTQTSPVQVRVMESRKPPVRIISPGRCYRVDSFDASHSPVFHQIEGLYVDTNVTLSDLTGTLDIFFKALYGPSTKIKLTPHFFPFTEPSAELQVSCPFCEENGCTTCGHTGWIEVMGCGMVHPNVFKSVGYDTNIYTGFAFGMGVERICMLKYGIHDLRLLFGNDLRFIRQF